MERIIKFRAWIEESKTMEIGLFGLRSDGKSSFNKESILLQFTGLKDKNGVEIYEGDILKSKKEVIFICKYVGVGFKFCQNNDKNPYSSSGTSSLQIIGNIYQNTDLLTPTKQNN